ncbi:MAG: sulfite exporter TauE/SafE family protein [Saprospiraceae bacterium]|nr:sulfite exporter TauE/SafE family protein [Saprospiraceae bacterium]
MIEYGIAIAGGFIAGIINTLAGNGSAITLTILTEILGLPANVANGSNRIGVLAQTLTSSWEFKRKGILDMKEVRPILWPFVLGALIGVYFAITISNEGFMDIFGALLVLLLVVILLKPKRWLQPELFKTRIPKWLKYLIYIALGFYGGFIQMGMGIFFLATLVLLSHYHITPANAIKLIVVGVYTVLVLLIFQYHGLIDWKLGGIIAIGQAAGGWITANYAARFQWMEKVAYYLLIFIIVGALVYFYELMELVSF